MVYMDITDIYKEIQGKHTYTAIQKAGFLNIKAGDTHGYHWALNS